MKTLCGPNSRQLMKRSEYDIHVATVDYLHALGPKLKSHFFHVPNEGRHTVKYRVKLKRLGVKAGVPDLLFVLPGGRLGCVELKSDKGRQSKAQKEFEKTCEHYDVPYVLARSPEEVVDALRQWGAL